MRVAQPVTRCLMSAKAVPLSEEAAKEPAKTGWRTTVFFSELYSSPPPSTERHPTSVGICRHTDFLAKGEEAGVVRSERLDVVDKERL